jgi:hypothetical protein
MPKHIRFTMLPLLIMAVLAIAQQGCSRAAGQNKHVTKENFEKIKEGMTYDQLQDLFGDMGAVQPPATGGKDKDFDNEHRIPGVRKIVKWENGDAWIKILFGDDKVVERRAKGLE